MEGIGQVRVEMRPDVQVAAVTSICTQTDDLESRDIKETSQQTIDLIQSNVETQTELDLFVQVQCEGLRFVPRKSIRFSAGRNPGDLRPVIGCSSCRGDFGKNRF
jgi:hypothetical protein